MSNISFKHINKLAIPAIISGVSEPLLSLADAAVVGNMNTNPTEALAAVGIVSTFLSMLIWVLGQTRSSISAILSQHLGAGKLNDVKNLPAQAIAIITSLSLVIIATTYPLTEVIYSLLYGAKGIILNYCKDYYQIRLIGFPFTLFTIAIFGTFRGLQNTYYPMLIAIAGTVINIVLDFVLVYGIDGVIPAMNLNGAAYASVIAQVFMAIQATYLLYSKTEITLKLERKLNPKIKDFMLMILNLFVRTLALNVTLILAARYATQYGDKQIAAYTIAINLWFFGAFLIDGYSSAGNILTGKLYGEKNYPKLIELSKKLMLYGFVFGIAIALIGSLFYNSIPQLFSQVAEVQNSFKEAFWIVLIMQPICAIAFIYDGIFKGLGQMKILRNVLMFATFLVFIPTIYITDYNGLKLQGVFLAIMLWVIARAVPLIIKFRQQFLPLAQIK